MPVTNNVNDLSLETRQAIADKANEAWMTAEQVKAQLGKVWVTETNPVTPTLIPTTTPVVNTPTQTKPVINAPIDTKTGAPVWEKPAITSTGAPINATPKATTPKTTTQEPIQAPISYEDWKAKGSTISWLEQLIESKYNTVLTNENWVLKWNIDWIPYEWQIDKSWNAIKTKAGWENPDDIYNMLASGQTIPDTWVKTTKAYSTAKARYDIASKYTSYTEDQLYRAYVNWEIGSQLEKDLAWNPYLSIAKEKYNKKLVTDNINKDSTTILTAYNKANWKEVAPQPEEKSFLEKLSDKINESFANKWDDIMSFKDYMSTNYPDLVNDTKELNQKNMDLKVLVDERDARLENIIKENPWISVNRATMLAARQNKEINDQIKSMSYEIWNLQANINYQTTMADKEYGYELQNQARQDQLTAEQRWMQFSLLQTAANQEFQKQMTAEERAYNEQQYQKQLEDKFNYEYGDLNSTNPQIQRVAAERIASAIQKQYEWMPFRRDVSTMWADILNELASGKTIEQITKDITNSIQNAPTYKQWAMNKWLIAQPTSTKYSFTEVWWNLYRTDDSWNIELAVTWPKKWSKLDDWTYQDQEWNIITKDELQQQKLLENKYLNAEIWTNVWIECGQYARSATWLTATPGWNSLNDRIKVFSEQSPQPGWMVLFTGGWYDKTYWHIAVVTWVNPENNTITVKESNLNWDKKITEREISMNDKAISWYYNNTPLAWWWKDTSLSDTDIFTYNSSTFKPQSDLKTQVEKDKYAQFLSNKKSVMSDKNADIKDILYYSAGWKDLTDTSIKSLEKYDTALTQIWAIQKQISKMSTWPVVWRLRNLNPYDTDAQTLKAQLTALIPNLARWVYWEVWVLTDNDIKNYSKTIPTLTSTNDVNNAILAMTMEVIAWWYKKQLQSLAAAWKDVSWYSWLYDNLMWQVKDIKTGLWMQQNISQNSSDEDIINFLNSK